MIIDIATSKDGHSRLDLQTAGLSQSRLSKMQVPVLPFSRK